MTTMTEEIGCSLQRMTAMLRRHWYLLSGSWTRIVELIYWPAVQMIMWGFLTQFLAGKTSYVAQAFGVFIAGMMLWDSMFRVQLGVAISFLEEMWSRNLGNLFVSPLRPGEFAASVLLMGLLRTLVGMLPVSRAVALPDTVPLPILPSMVATIVFLSTLTSNVPSRNVPSSGASGMRAFVITS